MNEGNENRGNSLGDESTEPISDGFPSIPMVEDLLAAFLEHAPTLSRLDPYVQRIFYDTEHECCHVWLRYKTPISRPSRVTLRDVTAEMEHFMGTILLHFSDKIAVSVQMN